MLKSANHGSNMVSRRVVRAEFAILLLAGACVSGCGSSQEQSASPDTCYSSTQNVDIAYMDGAMGCPCEEPTQPRCVSASGGGLVALECEEGFWRSVIDGACRIEPDEPCVANECPASPLEEAWCSTDESAALRCIRGEDRACYWELAACSPKGDACGASASGPAECSDEEYCAYQQGQDCGTGGDTADCQPRPTDCDDVDQPVCGCDGNTYVNPCEAHRAGTGMLGYGRCI